MRLSAICWRPVFALFALFGLARGGWAAAQAGAAAPDSVAGEYSHHIWRIEDGLPQNRIHAIAQTPDGYLWVGTPEGLARFDGTRFTVFDRSNTPAFQDSSILALTLTQDGALWIGTDGGGLVRYQDGVFRHFGPAAGLTNGFVRSIFQDRSGTLWVGTDRGFFRLTGSAFVRLDGTPAVPLASVVSVAQDAEGRIWVNSPASLLTVSAGKLERTDCSGPKISTLAESRGGFLWALTPAGISRIRGACPIPERLLPALPARSLVEDSLGDVWIGTAGMGLFRAKSLAGRHAADGTRLDRFTSSSILPDDTINVVFEDREANLWIGSDDGLLRLRRSRTLTIGNAEGLEDDDVLTTYIDQHDLWLTTLSGQVYRVRGRAARRFRLPAPAEHAHVLTVLRARDGALWFGTNDEGVVRLEGGRARVHAKGSGLRSNVVRQLLQDRSGGAIWMALDSGMSRWDGKEFRNYYLEDGLSYPSTRCLLQDAKGDILVGTDSGLNRFHGGTIVPDPEFASVAKERIWAIYEYPVGTLWLGTRGGGLLRLRAGKLARFTIGNGLPSNSIYQILADGAGSLWMSSSLGVFSADPTNLNRESNGTDSINVTWFGTADGMKTTQMNGGIQPAGASDASSALWFPTAKGAVRINPLAIPARRVPPLLIERLVVDGAPLRLSGEVTIPPGHRNVEIDFTFCDLVAAQPARFRYKLEGLDEGWNSTRSARSVFYSNLRPGHYRFRVKANDPFSASSTSEATLSFTLRPEFYQTAWFFGLVALACGGLIWGGVLLYGRQVRVRYSLVLGERMAERSRMAREIHDTVIQGCVGVSALLEAIDRCRGIETGRAGGLLDDARAQIRSTVEEARQAIWNLRYASAQNASVSMLFDLARKLGAEQHIEVETEMAGRGQLGALADRTLLLVGREALRNAVAHGRPTHIRIGVGLRASEATLEVRDDGVGFDVTAGLDGRNHFGIIGMRERVESLGGSLLVESGAGNGTKVTATVPLAGNGAGQRDAGI